MATTVSNRWGENRSRTPLFRPWPPTAWSAGATGRSVAVFSPAEGRALDASIGRHPGAALGRVVVRRVAAGEEAEVVAGHTARHYFAAVQLAGEIGFDVAERLRAALELRFARHLAPAEVGGLCLPAWGWGTAPDLLAPEPLPAGLLPDVEEVIVHEVIVPVTDDVCIDPQPHGLRPRTGIASTIPAGSGHIATRGAYLRARVVLPPHGHGVVVA